MISNQTVAMTPDEINAWIASAKFVTFTDEDYDEGDLESYDKIYEKDGRFYSIHFRRNHNIGFFYDTEKRKFIKDLHGLTRVRKIVQYHKQEDWVPMDSDLLSDEIHEIYIVSQTSNGNFNKLCKSYELHWWEEEADAVKWLSQQEEWYQIANAVFKLTVIDIEKIPLTTAPIS